MPVHTIPNADISREELKEKTRKKLQNAKGVRWTYDEKVILDSCKDKEWIPCEDPISDTRGFLNTKTGKKIVIPGERCTEEVYFKFKYHKQGKCTPEEKKVHIARKKAAKKFNKESAEKAKQSIQEEKAVRLKERSKKKKENKEAQLKKTQEYLAGAPERQAVRKEEHDKEMQYRLKTEIEAYRKRNKIPADWIVTKDKATGRMAVSTPPGRPTSIKPRPPLPPRKPPPHLPEKGEKDAVV